MSANARALPIAIRDGDLTSQRPHALTAAAPALLYALFVLSGAAGLIYESIWSRYLGLFLGHSAYAQVLVLAIFLGGMSVGAALAGSASERLRRPLVWYAGLELAAGVVGLVFHNLYTATTGFALSTIFPALAEAPTALLLVKLGIGAALILPQSLLLGATFPLMSAGVVRHLPTRPGRTIAVLYFANSSGAAIGVLLSGFWLIRAVGLPGTVLTAALVNIIVAAAAYLIGRALPEPRAVAASAASAAPADPDAAPLLSRNALSALLLFVAFGTAVASFIYEITWIRMLSLVLGSATHSFDLMLSAFILGLALGALCVRALVDRETMPLRMLAQVQWAMGAFALITLPVYIASFGWIADLLQTFARTPAGYGGFNLARYALCLAVMLPATFCAGMTLPLLTRSLLGNGWGERAIGWVYSINTLGSIIGVGLAGLVLMPALGLQRLLVLGAVLDMGLAVLLVAYASRTRAAGMRNALLYGGVTVAAALAIGATALDPLLLSSGVFRHGRVPAPGSRELRFYRDGRTSSVAVFHTPESGDITLATNGKPDASLSRNWFGTAAQSRVPMHADSATQVLLALTSMAHRPQARSAAIVGFGSGMTSHVMLGSPSLERVTTIEIEPAMIDAGRAFYPVNRRAYDDPRGTVLVEDAKSFFAASPQRFDLILSEPSNPWVSGVSSLFGEEFYRLVSNSLADGGVFAQWLQLYEIDDVLVLSVLAAVHQHFGAYEIFVVGPRDVLIVAGRGEQLPSVDWSVAALPAVADDLSRFVTLDPRSLEATRFLNRAALAPVFAIGLQPNSDFFPILDVGAEEARFLGRSAAGFIGLSLDRFPVTAALVRPRPLPRETAPAVEPEPLFESRARAARLHTALASGDFASLLAGGADADAAYRLWQWNNLVSADRPPADWPHWVHDTVAIEADLHAGSAGQIDELFYATVRTYLARHGAPPPARAALRFTEGLGRWDFPAASAAADELLPEARAGRDWLPPRMLLDGAVAAKLQQHDVAGARAFRDELTLRSGRTPDDVRRLLIDAYIAQAS